MSATSESISHPLVALPAPLPASTRFLPREATPRQLIQAAASNHTEWFIAGAQSSGGEVHHTNGVTWTLTRQEITIAFPRLSKASASETLDAIMAECYARKPERASCWSLTPTCPRDLGARIAARGFEWGWRPHWMALNVHKMSPDFSIPEGLHIAVDDACDWSVNDMPYYRREDTPCLQALVQADPRRTWHFGAWLDSRIVGHSTLFLTTGPEGVGGLYNVGVVPSARRQGIGRAVSLAACQFARALGCNHVLLNSAADTIYERLGFESLGYGQSWWMHAPTLAGPPPTSAQIAFAEAIGSNDAAALDSLERAALPNDLNAPLPNGMTPMELAVRARKPVSAEWLVAHGAALDILHAWDLGWKRRARRMLAASPTLVNRRRGDWQVTPLHEAVDRDDIALVRLLLAAKPDLDLQDTAFHSTPLGWAKHYRRTQIIVLLEQSQEVRR